WSSLGPAVTEPPQATPAIASKAPAKSGGKSERTLAFDIIVSARECESSREPTTRPRELSGGRRIGGPFYSGPALVHRHAVAKLLAHDRVLVLHTPAVLAFPRKALVEVLAALATRLGLRARSGF